MTVRRERINDNRATAYRGRCPLTLQGPISRPRRGLIPRPRILVARRGPTPAPALRRFAPITLQGGLHDLQRVSIIARLASPTSLGAEIAALRGAQEKHAASLIEGSQGHLYGLDQPLVVRTWRCEQKSQPTLVRVGPNSHRGRAGTSAATYLLYDHRQSYRLRCAPLRAWRSISARAIGFGRMCGF